MDWKNQFVADTFHRLTPEESAALPPSQRQKLGDLIENVGQTGAINENHIQYFDDLIRSFSAVARLGPAMQQGIIRFEGGVLSEDSLYAVQARTLALEDVYGKTFWSINLLKSHTERDGIFAASRPLPVKWHLSHIEERSLQRNGRSFDYNDPMFMKHNAVALAMLRVFEDEFPNGPEIYHPFLLPERNGVLLGHTMHSSDTGNRIHLTVTPDWQKFAKRISPYERQPSNVMTVRTFFGEAEMTPAMKLLRQKLLPLYSAANSNALGLELDSYCDTNTAIRFEDDPRTDCYFDNVISLADLMKTNLWRQATKLPAHFRTSSLSLEI